MSAMLSAENMRRPSSGEKIDYPESDTLIQEGDTYLLVGEVDELAAFKKLASGAITQLPEDTDSSLWVLVSEGSVVIGESLAQLEFQKRFGSTIQAIRRQGKYLRFPDGKCVIKAGDKLLVAIQGVGRLRTNIRPAEPLTAA
jgi:CPA2 family monovalent cation:H+ antiporter-2